MRKLILTLIIFISSAAALSQPRYNLEQMSLEPLNRGVVALREGNHVVVSWRTLRSDRSGEPFHVYRNGRKLTLKEYLMDYASPQTRSEGERLIAESIGDIPEGRVREKTLERLRLIEAGERDFRF